MIAPRTPGGRKKTCTYMHLILVRDDLFEEGWGGWGCTQFVHGRSHMAIHKTLVRLLRRDRAPSGFHQPDLCSGGVINGARMTGSGGRGLYIFCFFLFLFS